MEPGDRVKCVKCDWEPEPKLRLPAIGGEYTVREVYHCAMCDEPHLLLEELSNVVTTLRLFPHGIDIGELGFPGWWFKPIQGRTTDISAFKELLKTRPKVPEDA